MNALDVIFKNDFKVKRRVREKDKWHKAKYNVSAC